MSCKIISGKGVIVGGCVLVGFGVGGSNVNVGSGWVAVAKGVDVTGAIVAAGAQEVKRKIKRKKIIEFFIP